MSKPIPVKLDEALLDRIEKLSQKVGEPKSTLMRFAMRIGLESLEKVLEISPEKALSDLIRQSKHREGGPNPGPLDPVEKAAQDIQALEHLRMVSSLDADPPEDPAASSSTSHKPESSSPASPTSEPGQGTQPPTKATKHKRPSGPPRKDKPSDRKS